MKKLECGQKVKCEQERTGTAIPNQMCKNVMNNNKFK